MPCDRHFRPDARVAGFSYLLGLDLAPGMDPRSPRVVRGDPMICAKMEAANRLANPSFNSVLSMEEWIADSEAEKLACKYVEEVCMAGVPSTLAGDY